MNTSANFLAFLTCAPFHPGTNLNISKTITSTAPIHHRHKNATTIEKTKQPCMLQSPNADGPPSLGDLDSARDTTSIMQGAAVTFSTSRISIPEQDDNNESVTKAVQSSINDALSKLTENDNSNTPGIIHVTFTPDLPAHTIFDAISSECPVIGRSIAKEGGSPRTIEVLMLAGSSAFRIGVGKSSKSPEDAISKAVSAVSEHQGIFGLFVTSEGIEESSVRSSLSTTIGMEIPLYGGPGNAVFINDTASKCLMDNLHEESREKDKEYMCGIVLIDGSASFLVSAVVKNWAQPKYVHPLEFLKPRYKGDPELDLLESIKFDDFDTFVDCFEKHGIDVNYQWATKQHQVPLLAAAGRGRLRMVKYLLENGADFSYRNDGGFNAVMYTLRLNDYGDEFVETQLNILKEAGADLNDTDVIIPPPRA